MTARSTCCCAPPSSSPGSTSPTPTPSSSTTRIDSGSRSSTSCAARVGRAGQRAYAYMMYPPARSLTEKADKRLDVIGDLQDLGAGFKLAMRDLEIRGAGNLLGEEQHGEIAAVGLELYNHLLADAVTSLQGKPVLESPAQVTVTLPVAAFLPGRLRVSDERLRLRCYQELAACVSEHGARSARARARRSIRSDARADIGAHRLAARPSARRRGRRARRRHRARSRCRHPSHARPRSRPAERCRQFRGVTATPSQLHLGDAWQTTLTPVLRELGPAGASAAVACRLRAQSNAHA